MDALIDFSDVSVAGESAAVHIDVVAVQGTIAAGKSTLIERARVEPWRVARELGLDAAEYGDAFVLPEPLDRWRAPGNDVLAAMYADVRVHGLRAQKHMARTRLEYLADEIGARVPASGSARLLVVIERSPLADRHVFARNMHEAGLFDDVDWVEYCEEHDRAIAAFHESLRRRATGRQLSLRTRATVVLYVGVAEALRRIRARGRACELESVDAAALAAIHASHRRQFSSALWLNTERVDAAALCASMPLLPPPCAGVPA